MKAVGGLCVTALLVGVVVLRLSAHAGNVATAETQAASSATLQSEAAPPDALTAEAREAAAVPPMIIELAQQAAPPQERRRSRRWRSRNRYPGPIPTPEEWVPPEGPVRIALQAGHWRAKEAPAELSGLRDNGTQYHGTPEWEVNLEIAQRAAGMLEELGYVVDVLPAVVPPDYRAHLFIAIHADGSNDPSARGFRVAAPSRDATGRAEQVVSLLQQSYGAATNIRRLPDNTRRMRNYYAFNYRRYEHALHPMTIAVILETGFLTSASDRRVIVDNQDRAARGIVGAVTAFSVTALQGNR